MNRLKTLRRRDDSGFTLLELAIAVAIFGLMTTMIFQLFMSTNETARTVRSGVATTATSQVLLDEVSKEVRNAAYVEARGDSLTVARSDGQCVSWTVSGDKILRAAHSKAFSDLRGNDWVSRVNGVKHVATTNVFEQLSYGVRVNLTARGADDSGVKTVSETHQRMRVEAATPPPCAS